MSSGMGFFRINTDFRILWPRWDHPREMHKMDIFLFVNYVVSDINEELMKLSFFSNFKVVTLSPEFVKIRKKNIFQSVSWGIGLISIKTVFKSLSVLLDIKSTTRYDENLNNRQKKPLLVSMTCDSRRSNLPWLYYGEQSGLASRILQTEPLPVGFSFKGAQKVSCAGY